MQYNLWLTLANIHANTLSFHYPLYIQSISCKNNLREVYISRLIFYKVDDIFKYHFYHKPVANNSIYLRTFHYSIDEAICIVVVLFKQMLLASTMMSIPTLPQFTMIVCFVYYSCSMRPSIIVRIEI